MRVSEQRIWRDSEGAGRQAFAEPQIGTEIYGKILLGVDDFVIPM